MSLRPLASQAPCFKLLQKSIINSRFTNLSVIQSRNISQIPEGPVDDDLKKQHLARLQKYYSPELLESIMRAETFIKPDDWKRRKYTKFEFAPPYLDDLSKYDPFYDFGVHEWKDFNEPYQPVPQDVPEFVKISKEAGNARKEGFVKLSKMTGYSADFLSKLTVKTLSLHPIRNMTSKGKSFSMYVICVVGDQNGMVGIGQGVDSNADVFLAKSKATANAIMNMTKIPRYEDRTIFQEIDIKYHSIKLSLRPSPPGDGLRVNHIVYEICKAAGIKDLSGKVKQSRNRMNVAKATLIALNSQVPPEQLALGRGKKSIDLRKAYYNTL